MCCGGPTKAIPKGILLIKDSKREEAINSLKDINQDNLYEEIDIEYFENQINKKGFVTFLEMELIGVYEVFDALKPFLKKDSILIIRNDASGDGMLFTVNSEGKELSMDFNPSILELE